MLGSNSLSSKNEIDSTPSHKFRHNSSTFAAPGKRPAKPMIATPSKISLTSELIIIYFLILIFLDGKRPTFSIALDHESYHRTADHSGFDSSTLPVSLCLDIETI
ncbi:hypothetical protein ES703_46358 [subsurface metagenome]